jgi:hypothetical protein
VADSAETNNVFIDTEVFDCHQFDFASLNFRRLVRLVADGPVRVLLTTITVSEIRSHLDEHAVKAFKQVTTASKLLPLTRQVVTPEVQAQLSSTTSEEFQQTLHHTFDTFLHETDATVLSVKDVPPEEIFKAYFEARPPFSNAAKKNEFPDAFASAALRTWVTEGGKGKVYVVSNDKDWRRLCQEGDEFIHIAKLPELLEKFADSEAVISFLRNTIDERREEIKAKLDEEAQSIYFFSADGVEPEIEEPDSVEVTIDDYRVIEVTEGQAVVSLACKLEYTVTVTDDDPDSGYTDPDDRERRYVYRRSGQIEGDTAMEATLTLQFDKAKLKDVTLGKVSFPKAEVEVSFEDHDLIRDDDNDYGDEDDRDFPDDEPPEGYEPPDEEEPH